MAGKKISPSSGLTPMTHPFEPGPSAQAEGSLEVSVEQSAGIPGGENTGTDRYDIGIGIGAVWQGISTGAASLQGVYGRRDRAGTYGGVL